MAMRVPPEGSAGFGVTYGFLHIPQTPYSIGVRYLCTEALTLPATCDFKLEHLATLCLSSHQKRREGEREREREREMKGSILLFWMQGASVCKVLGI